MAEIHYDRLLARGGFGRVYSGIMKLDDKAPSKDIALKRVRHVAGAESRLCPLLRHEACALVLLKEHPNIPKVYAFGASQYYEYLAMQRLGMTLHEYFEDAKQQLTLCNVVSIAYQMLDVLEYVHSRGIVHCDISPSNMMFDVHGPSAGIIYLIDFGLCRSYIDQSTGQHRPDELMTCRRGNATWISLNGHNLRTPSRRDDLESLAYVLIWLLRGGVLPWGDGKSADVYRIKSQCSGAQLCESRWPPVFGEFLDYCRSLKYKETPSYAFWKHKFADVAGQGFTVHVNPQDSKGPFFRCAQSNPKLGADRASDGGWEPFMGGRCFYIPCREESHESVWSLSPKDLLRQDELHVVVTGVARLRHVPESKIGYIDESCPQEELL
ncbi:kinase-like protein [Lentinus tigrinus ALCF2SS1-7]|uniref:Kinase-like protein n=1 Tax=Lentinus tigrinus ALCF2SS1-6 TaxID=1328759 RepID=A0A5C2RPE9_9APHY|nr:kinase-like protein [Lentinus tigrinus ALCF2SS1-6]RPD71234.1 kinase-like protein [Lentinus tigrinus ALCF2SS1-7]